jgi:hypothetical protein
MLLSKCGHAGRGKAMQDIRSAVCIGHGMPGGVQVQRLLGCASVVGSRQTKALIVDNDQRLILHAYKWCVWCRLR